MKQVAILNTIYLKKITVQLAFATFSCSVCISLFFHFQHFFFLSNKKKSNKKAHLRNCVPTKTQTHYVGSFHVSPRNSHDERASLPHSYVSHSDFELLAKRSNTFQRAQMGYGKVRWKAYTARQEISLGKSKTTKKKKRKMCQMFATFANLLRSHLNIYPARAHTEINAQQAAARDDAAALPRRTVRCCSVLLCLLSKNSRGTIRWVQLDTKSDFAHPLAHSVPRYRRDERGARKKKFAFDYYRVCFEMRLTDTKPLYWTNCDFSGAVAKCDDGSGERSGLTNNWHMQCRKTHLV